MAVISFVVISVSSAVGAYYVITSEIEVAKKSPASKVEYQLKDQLIRDKLESLEAENQKLQEQVEELQRIVYSNHGN